MVVDLADRAVVEALADASRAMRVARQEHEWRVVALLGPQVDLRHRG
jgi:hypothetical protein